MAFFGAGTADLITVFLTSWQPDDFLLDVLSMLASIARASQSNFAFLTRLRAAEDISRLLDHKSAAVRAKVCNSLGNLFRHSNYFYKTFDKYEALMCNEPSCMSQNGWGSQADCLPKRL